MSFGIHPEFNPHVPTDEHIDTDMLLDTLEILDELAEGLGVAPLSSFCDARELPEDFDGDPDDALDLLGPRTDWYPIKEGLKTITALIQHLTSKPQGETEDDSEVVEDLQYLQRCLETGAAHKAEFRLELR